MLKRLCCVLILMFSCAGSQAADLTITQGATSRVIQFFVQDSSQTVIAGLTGLTSGSSGLLAYYIRDGDASATAITLSAGTVGTWSSGGFVQVDNAHMAGEYQLGIPNAALSAGKWAKIYIYGATNMSPRSLLVEITQTNNQDAVRGGMTALPNANSAASGGLPIIGSGAGGINVDGAGRVPSNVQQFNAAAVVLDANNFPKVAVQDWLGATALGLPTNFNLLSINGGGNVSTTFAMKKNTAFSGWMFHAVQSANHISDATGITWTATISKDGGAFGAATNAVTEIANGWYTLNFAAGDLNGNTIAVRLTGTGADNLNFIFLMNQ